MQKHFAWVGCEINRIITTGKESTRWIPSAFSGGIYSEGLAGLGGSRVKYPPCLGGGAGTERGCVFAFPLYQHGCKQFFVAFSRIEMEGEQLREIKLVNGVDAFDEWKQAVKWRDCLYGATLPNCLNYFEASNETFSELVAQGGFGYFYTPERLESIEQLRENTR